MKQEGPKDARWGDAAGWHSCCLWYCSDENQVDRLIQDHALAARLV